MEIAANPSIALLEVRERSTESISKEMFRFLVDAPDFQALIEAGIVSLVQSKEVAFGLRTSCYVGQTLIGEKVRLLIREKSSGALACLLKWSLPDDLVSIAVPSVVSADSDVYEMLARAFVQAVGYYLRHGRSKRYLPTRIQTISPRGRILHSETARLRANGRMGIAACSVPILSADLPCNQLLTLALISVDGLAQANTRMADVLELTRFYAPMFTDTNWISLAKRGPAVIATAFQHSLRDPRLSADLRKALLLGRALVMYLGAWGQRIDAHVPAAFFLNLELLFESAVRLAFIHELPKNSVQKGSKVSPPLLDIQTDRYLASPDVVHILSGKCMFIGDCKYKELDGLPENSDIYQLLSHAMAFQSDTALLIYPSNCGAIAKIGRSRSGTTVYVVQVRIESLIEDIREALKEIGVSGIRV